MKTQLSILAFMFLTMACSKEIEVINEGIGGNTTIDLLQRLESDVISQEPNLVLIMVGTNDMVNSGKLVPLQEYEENLQGIIGELEVKGIEVVLISPIPVDTTYLFERHNRQSYSKSPNEKIELARKVMKEISTVMDVPFIDMYNEFVERELPKHNKDEFVRNQKNSGAKDGVHPTAKGYELMAKIISKFLISNDLIESNMKIVCFGDSITKGVHMKGSGTAVGETYPATLSRLLNNTDKK